MKDGKAIQRMMTVRERKARRPALAVHGRRCMVCGMDFSNRYGPKYADCVHVHHLRLLSGLVSRGVRVQVEKDVIVICPNCHAAIHRFDDPANWKRFRKECGFAD